MEFLSKADAVFNKAADKQEEPEIDVNKLYSKIGQLEVERDLKINAYANWICRIEKAIGRLQSVRSKKK